MRVGQGFDVHGFAPGRRLMIGGVEVADHDGLAGHSDADVLCHAIADALLGAAALGDLGSHFPASGEWEDASGARILEATRDLLEQAGFTIVNVDATVIAEEPKLAPHREGMIGAISKALALDASAVSVKFTTSDGLGAIGRGEGIAASAVALITS